MKQEIILKSKPLDITTNIKSCKTANNIETDNIIIILHYDNIDIKLTFYASLQSIKLPHPLEESIKTFINSTYNDPYLYENLNKYILNKLLSYK